MQRFVTKMRTVTAMEAINTDSAAMVVPFGKCPQFGGLQNRQGLERFVNNSKTSAFPPNGRDLVGFSSK